MRLRKLSGRRLDIKDCDCELFVKEYVPCLVMRGHRGMYIK